MTKVTESREKVVEERNLTRVTLEKLKEEQAMTKEEAERTKKELNQLQVDLERRKGKQVRNCFRQVPPTPTLGPRLIPPLPPVLVLANDYTYGIHYKVVPPL